MAANESEITVRSCVSSNSTLCSAELPDCSKAKRAFLSSDGPLARMRCWATFSMNSLAMRWFSRPILSEPSKRNTTSTGRWTQLATAGSVIDTHRCKGTLFSVEQLVSRCFKSKPRKSILYAVTPYKLAGFELFEFHYNFSSQHWLHQDKNVSLLYYFIPLRREEKTWIHQLLNKTTLFTSHSCSHRADNITAG